MSVMIGFIVAKVTHTHPTIPCRYPVSTALHWTAESNTKLWTYYAFCFCRIWLQVSVVHVDQDGLEPIARQTSMTVSPIPAW